MAKRKERKDVDPVLQSAIDAAGGAAALARTLGVTVQAVSGWTKCPPRKAGKVAAAAKVGGARITVRDLCPEMFEDAAA